MRHAPAVVVVVVDADMGKSRLVREATTILRSDGWRVVTGFCHPLREPLPYGPVIDALGKVDPWLPDAELPPTASALARCSRTSPISCHLHRPHRTIRGAARHQLIQAVRGVLAERLVLQPDFVILAGEGGRKTETATS